MTFSKDLNVKYNDVLLKTQELEKQKKEYHIENVLNTDEFKHNVEIAEVKDYPHNFFTTRNLYNSNYSNVDFHDFEKFFYFCHEAGLNGNSGKLLRDVTNGKADLPIIVKGTNKRYWLVSGDIEMIAYKVTGMFPLVKRIDIQIPILI